MKNTVYQLVNLLFLQNQKINNWKILQKWTNLIYPRYSKQRNKNQADLDWEDQWIWVYKCLLKQIANNLKKLKKKTSILLTNCINIKKMTWISTIPIKNVITGLINSHSNQNCKTMSLTNRKECLKFSNATNFHPKMNQTPHFSSAKNEYKIESLNRKLKNSKLRMVI